MTNGPTPEGLPRKPSVKPRESVPDGPRPRKPARGPEESVHVGLRVPTQRRTRQQSEGIPVSPGRRPTRQANERVGSIQGTQSRRPSIQPREREASVPTTGTTAARTRHLGTPNQEEDEVAPEVIEGAETPVDDEDGLDPLDGGISKPVVESTYERSRIPPSNQSYTSVVNREAAPPLSPGPAPPAAPRPVASVNDDRRRQKSDSVEPEAPNSSPSYRPGSSFTAFTGPVSFVPQRDGISRPSIVGNTYPRQSMTDLVAASPKSPSDESDDQETPVITRVEHIVQAPPEIEDDELESDSDDDSGYTPESVEDLDDTRLQEGLEEEVETPVGDPVDDHDVETETEKEGEQQQDHVMSDHETEDPERSHPGTVRPAEEILEEPGDDMDVDGAEASAKRKRDQEQKAPASRKRSKDNHGRRQVPVNGGQEPAVPPANLHPPLPVFHFTPEQAASITHNLEGLAGVMQGFMFDAASRGIAHGIQMAQGIAPPPAPAGTGVQGPSAPFVVPPVVVPPVAAPPNAAPPAAAPPAAITRAPFADKKGNLACRRTDMRPPGCEQHFTRENPPFYCQREACLCKSMNALCTNCKNSGRGYLFDAPDGTGQVWFCKKTCLDADPRVIAERARQQKEDEDKKSRDERAEAAKIKAAEVERLRKERDEAMKSADPPKPQGRPKRKPRTEMVEVKPRQEEEDQEQGGENLDLPNAQTGPIGEKCEGCKAKWSDTKLLSRCEHDECPGHSICTNCATKSSAWKGQHWRKTKTAPYHWFCRKNCLEAFLAQLAEDGTEEKPVKPTTKKKTTGKKVPKSTKAGQT
ncbi:hypothetical protein E6O75_ATG10400 [Venturia nashicola]|uniref:Uncharacterized protein n=1 Tax=Venturia nashicola TaxID=86259 RepID=A0A4Z1P8T5_9PEZI|nr:hypothetical protein E6O75_ATG10400 [Venturia nashicola]